MSRSCLLWRFWSHSDVVVTPFYFELSSLNGVRMASKEGDTFGVGKLYLVIHTIFFTIDVFPIQFSIYTSCSIHVSRVELIELGKPVVKSELINIIRARDNTKKKIWVPNWNRTHGLPNTGRALTEYRTQLNGISLNCNEDLTRNRQPATDNGQRKPGTRVWERVYSGNLPES